MIGLLFVTGCSRPSDGAVATVGAVPITAEYVNSLVDREGRSALLISDKPHPVRVALDLAIRDQLLALEADRRGLSGPTRGELLAALIEQETRGLEELDVASISDAEARAWYGESRELFDEVASARIAWARFEQPETARAAFDDLSGSDAQTFVREVKRLPTVSSYGSEDFNEHDESEHAGSEYTLHRLANAARRSGVVCLDRDTTNGDWWLVRLDSVALEPTPWDPKFSAEVKGAMTFLREQNHLQSIADRARTQWSVRIDEKQVRELTR